MESRSIIQSWLVDKILKKKKYQPKPKKNKVKSIGKLNVVEDWLHKEKTKKRRRVKIRKRQRDIQTAPKREKKRLFLP